MVLVLVALKIKVFSIENVCVWRAMVAPQRDARNAVLLPLLMLTKNNVNVSDTTKEMDSCVS